MSPFGFFCIPRSLTADFNKHQISLEYRYIFITLLAHMAYEERMEQNCSDLTLVLPFQLLTSKRLLTDLLNVGLPRRQKLKETGVFRAINYFEKLGWLTFQTIKTCKNDDAFESTSEHHSKKDRKKVDRIFSEEMDHLSTKKKSILTIMREDIRTIRKNQSGPHQIHKSGPHIEKVDRIMDRIENEKVDRISEPSNMHSHHNMEPISKSEKTKSGPHQNEKSGPHIGPPLLKSGKEASYEESGISASNCSHVHNSAPSSSPSSYKHAEQFSDDPLHLSKDELFKEKFPDGNHFTTQLKNFVKSLNPHDYQKFVKNYILCKAKFLDDFVPKNSYEAYLMNAHNKDFAGEKEYIGRNKKYVQILHDEYGFNNFKLNATTIQLKVSGSVKLSLHPTSFTDILDKELDHFLGANNPSYGVKCESTDSSNFNKDFFAIDRYALNLADVKHAQIKELK